MEKRKYHEQKERESFSFSVDFEILPTDKAIELIERVPEKSHIRVTCRPSGYQESLDFARKLSESDKKRTVFHFAAARVKGAADMDVFAADVAQLGIEKVFLVRGDGEVESDAFQDTESLIKGFYDRKVFLKKIDIAGHPEGNHHDQESIETLLRKQEISELLGVEMEIVTQMCFDSNTYLDWLKKIRSRGVYLPVRAGVLGKVKIETLFKTLGALGVNDITGFIKNKPKLAMKMAEFSVLGYSPKYFIKDLNEGGASELGVVGFSVFTLGNLTSSVEEFESIKKE